MKYAALPLTVALVLAGQTAQGSTFFDQSKITLGLKNFYFNNDNRESQADLGNAAYAGQSKEWGQALLLNAVSGFTEGPVGFGLDAQVQVGLRLDGGGRSGKAGIDRTPGQLFPLDSDGSAVDEFSRLGMTAKARLAGTEIRYGTLTPRQPFLVSNDGRLLPQTFHGTQITSNDIQGLTLTGGLIEHATGRASTDRTGLGVSGGSRESNKLWFGGADWKASDSLTLQYYASQLEDYYTQHFAGLTHQFRLDDNRALKLDLRYFHTDSQGANASASGRARGYRVGGYTRDNSGEIDNRTWSAAATFTHGAHALLLGYQAVSDGSAFVQPNQGSLASSPGAAGTSLYLLTDRQITNFSRAGERTAFAEYSLDFSSLGVPGLKTSLAYLRGSDIRTAAGAEQQEWERDLRVDYTLQQGPLKGLALSWRNASLRSEASADTDQHRFIVSYQIALR